MVVAWFFLRCWVEFLIRREFFFVDCGELFLYVIYSYFLESNSPTLGIYVFVVIGKLRDEAIVRNLINDSRNFSRTYNGHNFAL